MSICPSIAACMMALMALVTLSMLITLAALAALAALAKPAAATPPTIESGKPRPHLFYDAAEIADFSARLATDPERLWYERTVVPKLQEALAAGLYTGSDRTALRAYFERLDEVALAALVDPDPALRDDLVAFGKEALLTTAQHYGTMQLAGFWHADAAPSPFALAVLYDSIHDALTVGERATVVQDLLGRLLDDAPLVADFDEMANKGVIAHMALGVVALAIEDQARFDRAYGVLPDDEPSYLWAIDVGYGDDGIWTEPTQHYHHYTMDHVLAFAIAAWHGAQARLPEVFETVPDLATIYEAYAGLASPTLHIAPTGDSRWTRTVRFIHGELLNRFYPDTDPIEWVLHHAYAPGDSNRALTNFAWDLVHVAAPGDPGTYQPSSRLFDDGSGAGFGVLRHGAARQQLYAFIDFASQHPNHDHRDKLSTFLAGHDRRPITAVVRDDRSGYGHTIFQNTVVIDRDSQMKDAGELRAFGATPGGGLQLLGAAAPGVYSSMAAYERLLVMIGGDYVLDVFTIERAGAHTYDWVQHRMDVPVLEGTGAFGATNAGTTDGYDRLTGVEVAPAVDSVVVADSHSAEHGALRTVVATEPGDQVYRAGAPGPRNDPSHPLWFVRREVAGGTQFASVHALGDGSEPPPSLALGRSGWPGGFATAEFAASVRGVAGSGIAGSAGAGGDATGEAFEDFVLLHRDVPPPSGAGYGPFNTDAKATRVRLRDTDGELVAMDLLAGSHLAADTDTLVDLFGVTADLDLAGTRLSLAGAVIDFRVLAPLAEEVWIDGSPVAFLRVGDYVVSPTSGYHLPPVADAGGPYAGLPGEPVAFDGSGSLDPEGAPLTYAWEFGDGATGSGAYPEHVYEMSGDYTVTLVVSDGVYASEPALTVASIGETAGLGEADGAGSAGGGGSSVPLRTLLRVPDPNPFGATAMLRYEIRRAGNVELAIYDVGGRRRRVLATGWQEAGRYARGWDGRDAVGRPVADGVYFVRLRADGRLLTEKLIRMR
ncbi:MAG: PKD domain-containing protein [Candidatus Eiseniibacteriota bacterium]|jgi:hypothetical protein